MRKKALQCMELLGIQRIIILKNRDLAKHMHIYSGLRISFAVTLSNSQSHTVLKKDIFQLYLALNDTISSPD